MKITRKELRKIIQTQMINEGMFSRLGRTVKSYFTDDYQADLLRAANKLESELEPLSQRSMAKAKRLYSKMNRRGIGTSTSRATGLDAITPYVTKVGDRFFVLKFGNTKRGRARARSADIPASFEFTTDFKFGEPEYKTPHEVALDWGGIYTGIGGNVDMIDPEFPANMGAIFRDAAVSNLVNKIEGTEYDGYRVVSVPARISPAQIIKIAYEPVLAVFDDFMTYIMTINLEAQAERGMSEFDPLSSDRSVRIDSGQAMLDSKILPVLNSYIN